MVNSTKGKEDNIRGVRLAIYFPFLYPWVLDLTRELSLRVDGEVRYYTTGTYGNYPWKEHERYAYLVPRRKLLGEIVPHPKFLFSFCQYRPNLLLLFATESLASLLLYMLCKLLRVKVIPVVEENSERTYDNLLVAVLAGIKRSLVKWLHKNARLVIAESEASKEYLARMGCLTERIRVIPHGTNVNYFQPKAKNLDLARKIGLSVEDRKKVIALFAGEFSEVKGAEYMTRAILSLSGYSGILFLIPRFGPIFLQYKESLGKCRNIRIYPLLHFNEMPALYCLSDIVIVPSKYYETGLSDRSPNSLIEAMACGKAVIGSNCGGIPTIMGGAGMLIPPNNPEAIVHATLTLASNKELMKNLGDKARERAVKVLNNKVYADCILDLWRVCG